MVELLKYDNPIRLHLGFVAQHITSPKYLPFGDLDFYRQA
jgi:hypothetical protein